MWLDDETLAPVRARYGEPRVVPVELEISREERDLVVASGSSRGRHHDVTLFVFGPDERLALIRKPHYGPGMWRPPGGGLAQGEEFEAGVAREAREELGVAVELERYLLLFDAVFTHGAERILWRTHAFSARTAAAQLAPEDRHEISGARWGSLEELEGPIRGRLLATGRALWRYRVALHDEAAALLSREPA
jgi:ADP-ribose pyrophosphatase YjhB (NUDIX family)